jgi:hypothetical protein
MKVESRTIADVQPYDGNPRKIPKAAFGSPASTSRSWSLRKAP